MSRDAERAANRARFPEFAAMSDTGRWKLLHAVDASGEVGRPPPLPPGCVEIDITHRSWMEDWAAMERAKWRKGK